MKDNNKPHYTTNVSPRSFFIFTFILSWLIWIPLVLSHYKIGPFNIPEGISILIRLVGVLMPAIIAIILTAQSGGRKATQLLFQQLAIWRVGWKWWAAAIFVYPFLLVLAALIYNLFIGNPPLPKAVLGSLSAVLFSIIFLLIAVLGEEIGWRGVALPGLQQRKSALISSVILGICWAVWHLPFWLLLDSFDQFGPFYLVLNFLLFPMTFYLTWLYNHGRSSLLLPVAFHLTFNIVNTMLLPVTGNTTAFTIFIVLNWVVTLLILRHLEPKNIPVQT
jgi:CAAX protease family protein